MSAVVSSSNQAANHPNANVNVNVNVNVNANEGNVIADEDTEEDEEDEEESAATSGSGIPHTWLNAAFNLSSCGTGLAATPPKTEDIDLFLWRQQQQQQPPPPLPPNAGGRAGQTLVPPPLSLQIDHSNPFHCNSHDLYGGIHSRARIQLYVSFS